MSPETTMAPAGCMEIAIKGTYDKPVIVATACEQAPTEQCPLCKVHCCAEHIGAHMLVFHPEHVS